MNCKGLSFNDRLDLLDRSEKLFWLMVLYVFWHIYRENMIFVLDPAVMAFGLLMDYFAGFCSVGIFFCEKGE